MIEIDSELCKGCGICSEFCPKEVLASSYIINKRGYYLPTVAREDKCTGCRLCELMCPELAILISRE